MGRKPPYDHTRPTAKQRAARRKNAAKATAGRKKAVADRREAATEELEEARVPPLAVSLARREAARAELAEIDVRERKAELVKASDVAEKFVEVVTAAKTKLLGIPARVKQRLPHIAAEDVRVIDDFLREALEELAGD